MNHSIVKTVVTYRFVNGVVRPGEDLHMVDGSVWFHPYCGWAPRRVR